MQFLYGDRELLLKVADLFSAPVDVIVNPANGSLVHGGGLAGQVVAHGGDIIQKESDQFIKEHGQLETGMVAITTAGSLPFQAILHAVGPQMGEGDEQAKVAQAVSNCLKLCSMHDWDAIAFPAISTGIFSVPVELVAQGFFRAITSFWDARLEGSPTRIIVCLTEDKFLPFFHAFRDESMIPDEDEQTRTVTSMQEDEVETGVVNIDDEELSALEDDELDDWFK